MDVTIAMRFDIVERFHVAEYYFVLVLVLVLVLIVVSVVVVVEWMKDVWENDWDDHPSEDDCYCYQ